MKTAESSAERFCRGESFYLGFAGSFAIYAGVVKLVYTLGLGPSAARRESSSLSTCTKNSKPALKNKKSRADWFGIIFLFFLIVIYVHLHKVPVIAP